MRYYFHSSLILLFLSQCCNVDSFSIQATSRSSSPTPQVSKRSTSIAGTANRANTVALNDSSPSLDDLKFEELTIDKIAELIEVSFIQACMQLAQGYVDVQKLLLAAIKSGYDANIPLSDLIKEVNECPVNSANRDLSPEEIDVRTTSMSLVYLTLGIMDEMEGKKEVGLVGSLDIPEKVQTMFGSKVKQLVRENLDMGDSDGDDNDRKVVMDDPMQAALMAHYERTVISLTLTVVDEERACDGDGLKANVPRPPIPGTS